MRFHALVVVAVVALLTVGPDAFGAYGPTPEKPASGLATVLLLGPPFLIIAFIVFLMLRGGVWKQGDHMAKARISMDRSLEHMALMERKTDRMLELLESIDRKLGQGAYRQASDERPPGG